MTCVLMRSKIARIVQAMSDIGDDMDLSAIPQYLDLMDSLDTKVKSFQSTLLQVRAKEVELIEEQFKLYDSEC